MSGKPDRSTSARAPWAPPAIDIARIGPRGQRRRIVDRRSPVGNPKPWPPLPPPCRPAAAWHAFLGGHREGLMTKQHAINMRVSTRRKDTASQEPELRRL